MRSPVELAPPARRALERDLPEGVTAAAWEFIDGALADNPRRVGKPLNGELAGLWSTRRGGFRIIYPIDDDRVVITLVRIGHRGDVYQ